MNALYPVRLSTVLRPVKRPVVVDRTRTYREIGVRSHGCGIFHKDPIAGADLGDKSVFWVEPGTLVFNIVFAWEGAVAVAGPAEAGFIASHRFPAYRVDPSRADARFLRYYFVTEEGLFLLGENSPGAAGRNKTLDQGRLLKEKVRLPSAPVQRLLADFLDRKIAAIDELVAKKERQIELLQEKWQAFITQTVTKGLDPNVPMVETPIGVVPVHWKVLPLRRLLTRVEQGWSPQAEDRPAEENEWAVLKLGAVYRGRFRPDQHKALPAGVAPEERYEVRAGDLLVTRANTVELVGDACCIEQTPRRLLLPDLIYRLTVHRDHADPRYLSWFLISAAGRAQIEADARGTSMSMAKVSGAQLRRWWVAVPPRPEQEALARTLNAAAERFSGLLGALEQQLSKLREYRQALITAAVTGMIDVTSSEAAA